MVKEGKQEASTQGNKPIKSINDLVESVFDAYNKHHKQKYMWGVEGQRPEFLEFGKILLVTYKTLTEKKDGK